MKYKHRIPLHLETQDHILGGLSARQLLLIGAGLAVGYLVWWDLSFLNESNGGLFLNAFISLLPALLGVVAAFFQPASRGLEEWAMVGIVYLAQPKRSLWAALPDEPISASSTQPLLHDSVSTEEEED